jgi:hypothetical protein
VKKPDCHRFDVLRARYLATRSSREAYRSGLAVKYGSIWERSWLARAEQRQLTTLERALERAGDSIYEYIQAISPRDWSYGVPAEWLRAELTYEDAVRPVGEPLSVRPPLAWGHRVHRT